ncbi:type II secretion system protein K-like protein [Bacteriovorax sp. BSW11_IV]|uniref:type II secretion system protein GspK n=1 Tax=Bacteriovorax sp. BSW11_IV TaxID=1353529 RepID=UPI00038A4953|nr:type II secretion system protein GspK [Bacteriovorax sp. BSW11_IV]EQC47850.1 type II secretion system protein K-like protein [Bacteriovorax sp. BSW11_IV]
MRKNQDGFTLVIVLISLVTLTFISMELMTLNEWNSYRGFNIIDKTQARLNAEAGLNMSLARLRVYQEAWNLLEKNPDIKKVVSPGLAEKMATYPFAYPIPAPKDANVIQKQAIEKFQKESLLSANGSILVSMKSITGFLNPNLLRAVKKDSEDEENESANNSEENKNNEKESPQVLIEKKLVETIEQIIETESEKSEKFATKFGNVKADLLVKELKYFVNAQSDFKDVELGEIEPLYTGKGISAKHAPMAHLDELYLLQGWDDELIELLKPRLSVHQVTFIQLNNITSGDLKIIFPGITDEQVKEFFKYRDGDKEKEVEASPFNNVEEFKDAVVNKLAIVDQSTFDKRIKELTDAGLKLGIAGKLFEIVSTGKVNEATYTITALVDMPVKPNPVKKKNSGQQNNTQNNQKQNSEQDPDQNPDFTSQTNLDDNDKDKEEPAILMQPRVVEIKVN